MKNFIYVSTYALVFISVHARNKPYRSWQPVQFSISTKLLGLRLKLFKKNSCSCFCASFGDFGCRASAALLQMGTSQSSENGQTVKAITDYIVFSILVDFFPFLWGSVSFKVEALLSLTCSAEQNWMHSILHLWDSTVTVKLVSHLSPQKIKTVVSADLLSASLQVSKLTLIFEAKMLFDHWSRVYSAFT